MLKLLAYRLEKVTLACTKKDSMIILTFQLRNFSATTDKH